MWLNHCQFVCVPNIPKKRQASILDVLTPLPPAAIADLVGADQPLTDADLQDIQELITRHLKSRATVMTDEGDDDQQDGDPGPAILLGSHHLRPLGVSQRQPGSRSYSRGCLLGNPK